VRSVKQTDRLTNQSRGQVAGYGLFPEHGIRPRPTVRFG
jgi:hypothetical protein